MSEIREYIIEVQYGAEIEGIGQALRYGERREEIVRCGECVHFRPRNADKNEPSRCTGVFAYVNPDPDGFCKWGGRDA